jgi:hypothetical protein
MRQLREFFGSELVQRLYMPVEDYHKPAFNSAWIGVLNSPAFACVNGGARRDAALAAIGFAGKTFHFRSLGRSWLY